MTTFGRFPLTACRHIRMQQSPYAQRQVDLMARLVRVGAAPRVDFHDRRSYLLGVKLRSTQEADEVQDQLRMRELKLQFRRGRC
ncbi:MAG: hypothetical protein E6G50_00585 [Actinobacteria bacterium]|nr:MAG: hypothetical protein E6G50_00585 [Actinomycetota bacterium]